MQALRLEIACELSILVDKTLKVIRRIQIVSEIEAQWPNRSLITQPNSHGMRCVIVTFIVEISHATGVGFSVGKQALGWIGLMPARQPLQQIVTGREDIAHIVKDREAETLSQIGQADGRKAQFFAVDEEG